SGLLAEPAGAPLPAEPDAPEILAGAEDLYGADLRTDEVVARIWIAPFVDADGVYREASHVRVVLEPAGWRLP
ncbi:MAG: TraV family lipoprotein, partial [Rhodospirillaceae bacterium]|nr:TraV family lipoprotein [Rhodospirillaceae bacterium]